MFIIDSAFWICFGFTYTVKVWVSGFWKTSNATAFGLVLIVFNCSGVRFWNVINVSNPAALKFLS